METISSRANPLCVHLRKLAASRSYRQETGQFFCDSPKLLREASSWGANVSAVLCTEGAALPPLPPGTRICLATERVMEGVSPMGTPQGVVFACEMGRHDPPGHLEADGRYVLLEGVQDPGNVGTILRTADGFGWTVFLLPGCADLYNPKTVRASMGVHFRRQIWRCSLERAASLVREAGLPLYGTALAQDTADVRTLELGRCAVILGSEGRGVSPEALALCDRTIRIPMEGTCESLNVAAAAAVVLWEGARGDGKEGAPCRH